jgi:hypothetical protein
MMKSRYLIWIGLLTSFLMVCFAPKPLWWMFMGTGIGGNGIVLAANGWKMPVRDCIEETPRHTSMMPSTRYKWLADIVPVGFGKASVGDILLAVGVLGANATGLLGFVRSMAVCGLTWLVVGWIRR